MGCGDPFRGEEDEREFLKRQGQERVQCIGSGNSSAEAKRLVDPEGAFENVTHFFAADGIGFMKQRPPALGRVAQLSKADVLRISDTLGAIAMQLESESLGS